MKSSRTPHIAIAGAVLLLALVAPATADSGEAYRGYQYSYGSFHDGYYYYSELDREDAERKARKTEERAAVQARMDQASEERLAKQKASRKTYVPKAPEQTSIIVNIPDNLITTERAMRSILEKERTTPPRQFDAPPAVEGTTMIFVRDDVYYYSDGLYYVMNGNELKQVPAPIGAMIFKLPEGFQTIQVEIGEYFICKGACYIRVMLAGQIAYKVVDMPEPVMKAIEAMSVQEGE